MNTSGQEEYELREDLSFKRNINNFKWTSGMFYLVKFKTNYAKHIEAVFSVTIMHVQKYNSAKGLLNIWHTQEH